MVKHIVMFKLRDEATQDVPARAKKELEAMVGVAPTLRSMEVGIDFSGNNPTADLVLTSVFDDRAGLAAYAVDPVHVAFLDWFRPLIAIRTVVDYEATE